MNEPARFRASDEQEIPEQQIRFHPHSFADPAGRLFSWRGELYRGIRSESAPVIRCLIDDGIIAGLVERGLLVETYPTGLKLAGYELILQHRTVPFPAYPEEWCPLMLKDAALTQLELLSELAACGFTLKDAHPWNILFDGWKPVYVDLASIVPLGDHGWWQGYEQFRRFFLNPLTLMMHGHDRIARRLLPELDGVSNAEVAELGRRSLSADRITTAIKRFTTLCRTKARLRSKESYRASLEQMRLDLEQVSFASDRRESNEGSDGPAPERSDLARRAIRRIADLGPSSLLCIGSDTNQDAKVIAQCGIRVVSFDKTIASVNRLYRSAQDQKLPILPLVMDFTDPTPARGLSSHWARAAAERFSCDMVLVRSWIQQTVTKQSLSYEQIVDGLAVFAKRWLVIHCASPDRGPHQVEARPASSSVDELITALRKQFPRVQAQASETGPILLCEK